MKTGKSRLLFGCFSAVHLRGSGVIANEHSSCSLDFAKGPKRSDDFQSGSGSKRKKPAERRFFPVAGLVCLTLALFFLPTNGQARSKTDEITLINGNVINGEIKELLQGKLRFSTDSMGTVTIEWEDILFVRSDFNFEVRLEGGSRLYGSMVQETEEGHLRVLDERGEPSRVAVLDVVELRPIKRTIADRFDFRISLGLSFDKASDVNTYTLNFSAGYEDERGMTSLTAIANRTEQTQGTVSSSQYNLSRQFWTKRPNVVRWLAASYATNDELDLDYRYTLGFGLGKALIDNNRQSLLGFFGIQGATELDQTNTGVPTERLNSLEGVLGANYVLWRFKTPEIDLETNLSIYPGITESGRWRGNGDIRLSWELVEDLYWDINGWYTYDNQSPAGSNSDYGVSTGLGWSY